jgi:hypothetical protein
MVEPVSAPIMKSVDDIPAVCLEEDLIAIFRLSSREMRLWRKYPEFIPFPPLPMIDRQIRVSGCVVAWFLAQDSGEYYRVFKAPFEELVKGRRGRSRPPWWKFAPPHGERYRIDPLEGEKPALSVDKAAAILRTTPSPLRRAIKEPDWPMPPANPRPLRWTEGQIERLLWAPQDHQEHQQRTRRTGPRGRRRINAWRAIGRKFGGMRQRNWVDLAFKEMLGSFEGSFVPRIGFACFLTRRRYAPEGQGLPGE